MIVMLNPSTATEVQNDPTIERCERRAHLTGFGAIAIGNLFAFRATDPKVMKSADDPVGPANDTILRQMLAEWRPDLVLCAWGAHGSHLDRGFAVAQILREGNSRLWHLGLTKHGLPRHPLYVSYQKQPEVWA